MLSFVLREHLCMEPVEAELGGYVSSRASVVASEHHDLGDAAFTQSRNGFFGFRTQRIFDAENAGKLIAHSKVED